MAIPDALFAEVQTALGAAVGPSLTAASPPSDLFEAFVWSIVVRAAQQEGATISYFNVDGSTPTVFTFRTSPGFIYSSAQPYSYARIAFPECRMLEAHVGVRAQGNSGVLHECDVLVLSADEAEACRVNETSPRAASLVIVLECKFYATPLPLGEARAFLGLAGEFNPPTKFLVQNAVSPSISKLVAYKNHKWADGALPGSQSVLNLQAEMQSVFRRFKALEY